MQCNTDDCLDLEQKNNGEFVWIPNLFQGKECFYFYFYTMISETLIS